jgi:hypothetical protein
MVAGGDDGLPWRRAGRQWLCLPVAIKKGGTNYGPEAFFRTKLLAESRYHQLWQRHRMQQDVLHAVTSIIGDWIAQGWGLFDKWVGRRVR